MYSDGGVEFVISGLGPWQANDMGRGPLEGNSIRTSETIARGTMELDLGSYAMGSGQMTEKGESVTGHRCGCQTVRSRGLLEVVSRS